MPLLKQDVQNLLKMPGAEGNQAAFNASSKDWQAKRAGYNFGKDLLNNSNDITTLDVNLLSIRQQALDTHSSLCTVTIGGEAQQVRVFPANAQQGNITVDAVEIFARGIDSARAVVEILSCVEDKTYQAEVLGALSIFQHQMKQLHQSEGNNITQAIAEFKNFNADLVGILLKSGVIDKRSHAKNAINFVRDFLWKRDLSTPYCVYDTNESKTTIRYSEPMTFEPKKDEKLWDFKWLTNTTITPPKWVKGLAKALGSKDFEAQAGKSKKKPDSGKPWLQVFLGKHADVLPTISFTPMTRFTPNLANAYDCTDIISDNTNPENVMVTHNTRTAISEPLKVNDKKARDEITEFNHMQMIDTKVLKGQLNAFMEKWGPLYSNKNKPIPFVVLNQTLIADEATFTPDQKKAKSSSVVAAKIAANIKVRNYLKAHVVIRDEEGAIRFENKGYKAKTDERVIQVDLLETNVGINMWQARTRVRNNDMAHSRQLIAGAVELLGRKPENALPIALHDALETVTKFLTSSNYSVFTDSKFRGEEVKRAVAKITENLKSTYPEMFQTLSLEARSQLALTMQAAVELKCVSHETYFGAARRRFNNFSRDYLRDSYVLLPVDYLLRAVFTAAALIARNVTNLFFKPGQMIKQMGERKNIYKATYEGLIAEGLGGGPVGGCMSAADRANEMGQQRFAMERCFAEEGRILGYNDTLEQRDAFYQHYGDTTAKHIHVEMATGAPVTSDSETKGIYGYANILVDKESKHERGLSKQAHALRKGAYQQVRQWKKHATSGRDKESEEVSTNPPSAETIKEAVREGRKAEENQKKLDAEADQPPSSPVQSS